MFLEMDKSEFESILTIALADQKASIVHELASKIDESASILTTKIEKLEQENASLKTDVDQLQEENEHMKDIVMHLQQDMVAVKLHTAKNEQYTRKNNIKVYGMKETTGEDRVLRSCAQNVQ